MELSRDTVQAEYYFRKLLKITLLISIVWNIFVFALTPVVMQFYDVAEETKRLTVLLVLIHNVFIGARLLFSVLLGIVLRMGVIGIAGAMCLDWCIRAVIFYIRFKCEKWKQFRLI